MKRFFAPKSIAIIGASENEEKVGGILVRKAKQYKGRIVPINPRDGTIQGLKAYNKISDYKGKIDLGIIAVPAEHVYSVLKECCEKGIKEIIIISAGFSEVGNAKEEKRIFELARKNKVRILGPNCFGICNPYENIDFTFSAEAADKGNVAFISQSGALWSYISGYSKGKFGFSGYASLGNMSDLEFSDFIEYFSKDKKTKAIVLYIEKLKDGKRFMEVCKKCKKPIYAVKAGSSSEGSKAAVSHTGSLATDYAVYTGAFKQAGVVLCTSLEEAFEKASKTNLIISQNNIKIRDLGNRVFIVTNAGGAGALASDYLSNSGFEVVQTQEMKNPLDIIGTAKALDYRNAFERIDRSIYDFLVVILTPQSMSEMEKSAFEALDFSRKTGKKVIGLFLGGQSVKNANDLLRMNNIVCFNNLEDFRRSLI